MRVRELSVPDSYELTPLQHKDERGVFLEWFKDEVFSRTVGHRLDFVQANLSLNRRGVVRGIHFADVPPGQAKYVTCLSGAVLDAVVDLRVGSPRFGCWEVVRLDEVDRRALYVAEGLGHAFVALTEGAVVAYLCSAGYVPEREHGVHPLDPDIGIGWPAGLEMILSPKDEAAPMLAAARTSGILPRYDECAAHYDRLRTHRGHG